MGVKDVSSVGTELLVDGWNSGVTTDGPAIATHEIIKIMIAEMSSQGFFMEVNIYD